MNISLNITPQIVLMPSVVLVDWKLNQPTTFFCTYCLCFSNIRKIHFNDMSAICHNFADLSDSGKVEQLLYEVAA